MSTTPSDPMEFLKSLWGNTGRPLPGLVTPTLDTNELEKRITDLKAFEGRFYNEELDTAYTAKLTNGKLQLFHIRLGEISLTDAGKDKFTARIEFPVQIEFVRAANGAVNGFRISNFGAKNVNFEKAGN